MYSPLAPKTPGKDMGVQDCVPPKVMELYEKHETEEESMRGNGVSKPSADELMDEQGKQSCQQPEIRLHGVEPSHKEIVEEAAQGVELCKTPRQKPRRKRHRPKVIQEDKTSKALKPANSKLVTPEPSRNKESFVKGKYTHEKLSIEDPDTPSIAVHEIIGYNYSIAPEKIPDENHKDSNIRVKRKYVRKKILQNDTALSSDKASERIGLQNMNLASKTPEQHEENVTGLGQQVKRKYIRKKKCVDDSEIATDVSKTVSTDPKETHVTRSARRCLNFNVEGPSQTIKGNMVSAINHSKSQSQEATLINTISFPNSKSTVQFDPGFEVVVENTPAGVVYDLNRSLNKMLEEYIELPEKTISNVQNGIGERLTENLKDVVKERDASSCTPDDDGVLQLELQHDQVHCGVDDVPVVLLKENVIEMKVTNTEPSNDVQYHGPLFPMIHKKRRTEKGQKDHKTISSRTYSHFKVYTITNLTKSMTVKKSQDKGCALRFDQIEVTTKKRSKMPIRARNSYSLAALAKALCANTCLKKRSKRSAPRILRGKNLHHIKISYIYDTDSSSKFQKSLYSNSMSQAMVPYVDPVEDITQKLKYLDICKESKEQEALALCAEGSIIVPVSGPLDLAPTRRPRPKVDLDAETDRVWKLLMWKEGKEEPDTLNKNKEKWWEDERQVFHGRVDSFIARMHLVQGDRRFSRWKGSVVDSVVGVFLTQNVSDHLSSSAFMALAARFPLQSRKMMWELNAERWCKSIIQQDKFIQPFDYMTWHGKMSIPEKSNQISVRVHEAKYTEGKMANSEEFLRNNNEGQMQDFQLYEKDIEIDHKTPNNITGSTDMVEESISLTKDEDSCVEDVIPSHINVASREGTSYDLTQTDQVGSSSKTNSHPVLMTESKCCCLENFSFMDLLQIQDTTKICGHCMYNNKSVPSTESCWQIYEKTQNEVETILTLEKVNDPRQTLLSKYGPYIDSHHDCMGMPHSSLASCGLGKSSECGEENTSCFSSPDVFNSSKFMDTTERICGHLSEFTVEATASMQNRRELDLRVESEQHPVEVSSTIAAQVNSDIHHDCLGMPHTSSTSSSLGKSSECGEENKSYFSSPNVFNSPKFMNTTERICGHSSEFTFEATANMPNRRESDLRVVSDQQLVEVSSTIATQVNSDPHHDCMGMPHTSLTSSGIGKLSECGVEDKSYFSSPNVFNSPKFMDTTKRICGHSSEVTIEAAANMPNRKESDLRMESDQHPVEVSSTTKEQNDEMHQTYGKSCNNLIEKSEVEKEAEAYLTDENHNSKTAPLETADPSDFEKGIESLSKDENQSSSKVPLERSKNATRGKKTKDVKNTDKTFDWDKLRKQVYSGSKERERPSNTMDSLDWESVRCADVNEISQAIRGRGMNNVLAERIKEFLNRLVGDHGRIDLEWLRDIEPDEAKMYLLSIRGLGLKSVECVRLLTLQHLAFPVDTNVGRICVRLGWVPLQPLPESLQLHLLELYPVLETIQKYLWPRLCTLDQRTLYELHYQMITFGKVFCTKSKPNCNACPMRGECKHFASAFASARLALPAGEVKSLVTSEIPTVSGIDQCHGLNSRPLPQLEGKDSLQQETASNNCEPIIEEPLTPEPEINETLESEIEDAFYEDPDEIPTIKLNLKEFTQNLQDVMRANNMDLQDSDLSKALVTISPEAASIPMPKLKNISRLRTEHQVYELPDSHPLLEEMDQRELDDPSPYLLAIWTPGETAESTQPPELYCNSQATGELCNKEGCFACNSIREARAQTVRATLLIPCRTAMRGSFPLNGTYFQVNEVFADHDSSCNPIDVPRKWIWNLPRRTVYFGTSVTTIFKGLSTEEIQQCFWRGFVCVRGFDRTSRAPRPLYARLHFPASKAPWKRKTPKTEE